MRFSFTILCLGCCLSRQWLLCTGQSYDKPSLTISANPPVITLGGSFYMQCQNQYPNQLVTFELFKEHPPSHSRSKKVTSNTADFFIHDAKRKDGGSYKCRYCFGYDCSYASDPVDVYITGNIFPKPSISVSASEMVALGEDVTIHCKSEKYSKAEFTLEKESSLNIYEVKKTESDELQFPIVKAQPSDAGIYRCSYCYKESAFYHQCSNYSDSVYINVTDPQLSAPFIRVTTEDQLTPGMNVSVECEGPENGLIFSLYKSGKLIASEIPKRDRKKIKFHLPKLTLEDSGDYTCRYSRRRSSFIWSNPSNSAELVVKDNSAIMWAAIAAGLFLLLLFLLVFAFLLYRKRRRDSTVKEGTQSANVPLESDTAEDPDGVSYAVLNHNSFKTKQIVDPDTVPESCTYVTLAHDRTSQDPLETSETLTYS